MDTVDSSLLSFISSSFPKGGVFFAEDLEGSGFSPDEIRWALTRLVRDQTGVVRLARGVFCVPGRFADTAKLVLPSPEEVAAALARRWRVRIAPCGPQAAFLAGLVDFQVRPHTWVSDGSNQVFHLQNGVTVRFERRLSMKVFQFRSETMRNVSEGLRFIGRDAVGARERGVVAESLLKVGEGDFLHDVRLCPGWIRELLRELR